MIRETMVSMIRAEPGIHALTLQYDVRRHCMVTRDAVNIEFLALLSYGYIVLDGEHRVWLGRTDWNE